MLAPGNGGMGGARATDKPLNARSMAAGRSRGLFTGQSKMSDHRFTIGQSVRLKRGFGASLRTAEIYRITAILPARTIHPNIGSATTTSVMSA